MNCCCKFEAICYYMLPPNEQGQVSWDENAGLALRVLFDPMSAWVWVIWVCSRIAPGLLQNRSGALPDRSLIAPGTHRPAPGTIQAAQGAKSGVKSVRKRKGKVSRLPQKCSSIVCKRTGYRVDNTMVYNKYRLWSIIHITSHLNCWHWIRPLYSSVNADNLFGLVRAGIYITITVWIFIDQCPLDIDHAQSLQDQHAKSTSVV